MNVIEELVSRQKLLSPKTRAPLRVEDGRVLSHEGRDHGPVQGPLDLLKARSETLDAAHVPPGDVARMREQLGLAQSDRVDAEIARAIAATGDRFEHPHLSAEARILADRFRMADFAVSRPGQGRLSRALKGGLGRIASLARLRSASRDTALRHISNSVGTRLVRGQEVFRSVRVRNSGRRSLAAAGGTQAFIDVLCTPALEGAQNAAASRTSLPVDIEPGREITLILRVRTPESVGEHLLEFVLSVPSQGVAQSFLRLPVEVVAAPLPTIEHTFFPQVLDYGAEHAVAMVEAVEFLKEAYPGQGMFFLEIGGGVHPTGHSLVEYGHRVVSSDISHSQSILGALYFRELRPELTDSLAFVSCDGCELPFAEAAFDGVMMFAAFHHFADPHGLLREIKRVVRPGGFVFVGCENCKPDPTDPQYREELRRGVNEQMWTLEEFAAFFGEAGLQVRRARVDGNSLKVGLIRP